ncbi:MAG: FAD binding domain-containing protein [Magnetovibrionaceae bacterium]
MKAAAFDFIRPTSLPEALEALSRPDAKVMSGGQSLGPMLNLRLARPGLVVGIHHLPDLHRVENTTDSLTLGAAITHAAIEDGKVPDNTQGAMAYVAADIAYRAVRNRGTIGGSLAHADPAADWPCLLSALGAEARIIGPDNKRRAVPVDRLSLGAFTPDLEQGEIIEAVRIPTLEKGARWGYVKFCRKVGEFADAMAAVVCDNRGWRFAIGATEGKVAVFSGELASEMTQSQAAMRAGLESHGLGQDRVSLQLHLAALRRSLAMAGGSA